MILDCYKMNIHCDDLGSQITFSHSEDESSDYFLIQRFYGDYEDANLQCYIECSNQTFCGHYKSMIIKLSNNYFELQNKKDILKINFEISKRKYIKLIKVLKIIVGSIPSIDFKIE